MSRQKRLALIVVGLLLFYAGLWTASDWWETALAEPNGAAHISPDGCVRVQQFRPHWLLFDSFHPKFHPDDPQDRTWFVIWERPAFFRLYDNRNGQLLGESEIYDLVAYGGPISWGYGPYPTVYAGMIQIGTTPSDCPGNHQG